MINALPGLGALKTDSLPPCWQSVLSVASVRLALEQLEEKIGGKLKRDETVFPADPWRALRLTPLDNVRVVILGQDPYHGPDQAQGLAFSVANGVKCPPSLRNIFQEIQRDDRLNHAALQASIDNDLTRWAQQGVLLLNTVLTVRQGQAASHARLGWQTITEQIIKAVAQSPAPVAFLLWGNHAQALTPMIQTASSTAPRLILKSNHPSPLSARRGATPFIGCGHFGQVNEWLDQQGSDPIAWL